ncbi:MAG: ABC transporter permease [Armatimonadota bacterium]|nr:ABC transporter permease [Armatimonadota bacterium]MDR5702223.1 ABC transporter permease [Armatimonadota bacterium]MDR7435235.1 ABC transporter permease [Armatimonadota bacterium]
MGRYLVRRLFQMIPLVLGLSVIIFLLLVLAPGDPVDFLIFGNPNVRPQDVARLKHLYGLDQPIYVRYFKWLSRAAVGDFGYSMTYKEPVLQLVLARVSNSLWLTVPAFFLALIVAIPVGVYSALHQYSPMDYFATFFAFFGVSIPAFWFGIMMIYFFAVILKWLPPGGFATPGVPEGLPFYLDRIRYMILPTVVLSLLQMAALTRYTRSSMLEVIRQDYVRTARSKGLPERVVINKHALRNALIPIVTILALSIPALFAGAPLTETVFAWPGIGRLLVEAVLGADFAVAQAIIVFLALLVIVFNLLADIAYALLDPRIRYD